MAVNIVEQATDLGFHYFSLPCALEERSVLKNVNLLPYKSMLSGNTCPNAASTPHSVIFALLLLSYLCAAERFSDGCRPSKCMSLCTASFEAYRLQLNDMIYLYAGAQMA